MATGPKWLTIFAAALLLTVAGSFLYLSTQPVRSVVSIATQPDFAWGARPLAFFYVTHLSGLSEPNPKAYPVTLLQFDLNAYDDQETPSQKARVLAVGEAIISHDHDINAVDATGFTSVHYAVANQCTDLVQFLITHGADLNRTSAKGLTPLRWARQLQNEQPTPETKAHYDYIIDLLSTNGAHD